MLSTLVHQWMVGGKEEVGNVGVESSVMNKCQQGGDHRAHSALSAAGEPVLEAGCKLLLPGITT